MIPASASKRTERSRPRPYVIQLKVPGRYSPRIVVLSEDATQGPAIVGRSEGPHHARDIIIIGLQQLDTDQLLTLGDCISLATGADRWADRRGNRRPPRGAVTLDVGGDVWALQWTAADVGNCAMVWAERRTIIFGPEEDCEQTGLAIVQAIGISRHDAAQRNVTTAPLTDRKLIAAA